MHRDRPFVVASPRSIVSSALALAVPLLATPGLRAQGCTVERASVASAGTQANGASEQPSISADGRFVAFVSAASDLVAGDTNGNTDAFFHDRATGATERVSVTSAGAQAIGGSDLDGALYPATSDDGRYVAFVSRAGDLVPSDTNNAHDVFLRDRWLGTTTRISVGPGGAQADSNSGAGLTTDPITGALKTYPLGMRMSADGRYVAFSSYATNLASGGHSAEPDIYRYDVAAGTAVLVSGGIGGAVPQHGATFPSLSADGRFATFLSIADNLVAGDTNGFADVFVRDILNGTTVRASVSSSGVQGNLNCYLTAVLSADGSAVAFQSRASNLVPGDTNSGMDVFVRDLGAGTTERVNVSSSGAQSNGTQSGAGLRPAISGDGRFVAFVSGGTNLVPGDGNADYDVFVHDRSTRQTVLVNADASGVQGDQGGWDTAISFDGGIIAFAAFSTNLVPNDTNATWDIIVRECPPPTYTLLCAGSASCPCDNAGTPTSGCGNSQSTGATLVAAGTPSVASDGVVLAVTGLPAPTSVIFFQGTTPVDGGVVVGDGLRCIGGTLLRLATRLAADGGASFGAGNPGDPSVSAAGALPAAGGTRHYQVYYRDAASFCTAATYNLTSAITISWAP